jgi:hypothetical protein
VSVPTLSEVETVRTVNRFYKASVCNSKKLATYGPPKSIWKISIGHVAQDGKR